MNLVSEVSLRTTAIAFCSDARMEVPLHVAAYSVLKHLGADFIARFYLMLEGVDVPLLRKTLDGVGRPYEIVLLATPDPKLFASLKPFFGGHAAYYRLVLPDVIPETRFLYLDTDTVTQTDIGPLFAVDMQHRAMGFVVDGKIDFTLERSFFLSIGLEADGDAFNSGVMLFDSAEWKNQQCFARIMDFCHHYPNDLKAADQTALNALFSEDCFHLDPNFNIKLSTVAKSDHPLAGILHFVGSPKPWDLLGSKFHPYHTLWEKYIQQTSLGMSKRRGFLNLQNWSRLPNIIGGYRRILRQKSEMK